MAYPPKTPTRHRSRSETKPPLSSSFYGSNNIADVSNPFIVASRPASPVKRSTGATSATLKKQASSGLIRKGGVESRLDVVTRDYVPPPPKSEKRSRSQPSVSSLSLDTSEASRLEASSMSIALRAVCSVVPVGMCMY